MFVDATMCDKAKSVTAGKRLWGRIDIRLLMLTLPVVLSAEWLALNNWSRDLRFPEFSAGMLFPSVSRFATATPTTFFACAAIGMLAAIIAVASWNRPAIRRYLVAVNVVLATGAQATMGYGIWLPGLRWHYRIMGIENEAVSVPTHPFAGSYSRGDGLTGVDLILTPNRFLYTTWGCLGTYGRVFGKIRVIEEDLELVPDPVLAPDLGVERIRLSIVHWGDRTYAVDDWAIFCEEVARRQEPRSNSNGDLFLRGDDWKKRVEGEPKIPARLARCFRGPPERSRVIEVRQIVDANQSPQTHSIVVLDAGFEDGVARSTRYHIHSPEGRSPFEGLVSRVHEKTSELEIFKANTGIQPGWEVTLDR